MNIRAHHKATKTPRMSTKHSDPDAMQYARDSFNNYNFATLSSWRFNEA